MNRAFAIKITLVVLLLAGLAAAWGCDSVVRGGANVILEGVTVGSVAIEGKPVTGLPSQKMNLVLKVASNEMRISTSGGKTTIKLNPSGATVVIAPEGTTFTGVKPEQVEIQWQTESTSK